MTFDEFIEQQWREFRSRLHAHRQWKADQNRAMIAAGPIGNKVGVPSAPEPDHFSASFWTAMELKRNSLQSSAVSVRMIDGQPTLFLFDLPVKEREGLRKYDIKLMPEVPA